ncbi:regulatory protein RecX [Actinoplanes missouriensis]|uniref:regulatory protein RecX n=1 Tax=Actinoplanes missouriensis TaxID=1866 RepID=UPI0036BEF4C9
MLAGDGSPRGDDPDPTGSSRGRSGRSAGRRRASRGFGGRDINDEGAGPGDRGFGGRDINDEGTGPGGRGFGGREGSGPGKAADPRTESEVAREICLRQLSARPRTRAELAKALVRKGISDEVIAEVLDRYDEVGIIDDAAFARAWVSSRHHGRGLARRALANELRQRGVDAEVASVALEAVDDEAEADAARALVDRKLRTATGTPDAVFRRLVAMLARKGYPAGVAIRAVKDALAARDAEAAEFADAIDPDALAGNADPDA